MTNISNPINNDKNKLWLIFILKFGLASLLIYWLYQQKMLDFAFLTQIRLDGYNNITLLFFSMGCVFVGLLLLAWRLWVLIRFQQFDFSYQNAVALTLVSSFFGVLLPGLVGGDTLKVAYICSYVNERRIEAFTAVVFDRVLGLYALLLLGSMALFAAFMFHAIPLNNIVFLLFAPSIVFIVSFGVLLLAWDNFFCLPVVQHLFFLLPKILQNMLAALRGYLKSPRLLLFMLLLSLLNHALAISSFIIIAHLLNDELSMFSHFVINPLAMLMNVVPLTPGGLGITESTFAILFKAAGSDNGAMVGLLGRLLQYLVLILSGSIALFFLKLRGHIIYSTQDKRCN